MDTAYEASGLRVVVEKVDSVTGDCNVSQRKGKALCIYDMVLQFAVAVTADDDTQKGTITVPEFVHDQEEDEYVFEINVDSHKAEIRKHFVPVLKAKLMQFQAELIKAHEKDVQHTT